MALGADHVKPTGVFDNLLVACDFGANTVRRIFPFAFRQIRIDLLRDAHVGVTTELNVGSAACHVRGDGDGGGASGLRNDRRFLLVITRVQNAVLDFCFLQRFRKFFRLVDGNRSDEDRLLTVLRVADKLDDRAVFFLERFVNLVVMVETCDGNVGRNLDDAEIIDFLEFRCFGLRRTGHAR